MIIRHGDLLLIKTDAIPQGMEQHNGNSILEGEVSNHHHRISKGTIFKTEPTIDNNYLLGYLDLESTGLLTHEEHKTIEVPAGKYILHVQREYDPIEERRVRD